jgi:hypothetical protein
MNLKQEIRKQAMKKTSLKINKKENIKEKKIPNRIFTNRDEFGQVAH